MRPVIIWGCACEKQALCRFTFPVICSSFERFSRVFVIRSLKEKLRVLVAPRPDVGAHRKAITEEFPSVVTSLIRILGKKLTAYVAGVKDTRVVERWAAGTEPYRGADERLRLVFQIAQMLVEDEHPDVVRAWFTGLNPELEDRAPIRLLRDGEIDIAGAQVLAAARAFLSGG